MAKEKEEIFEIINILDRIRLQQEFYEKLWPKADLDIRLLKGAWHNITIALIAERR